MRKILKEYTPSFKLEGFKLILENKGRRKLFLKR